jgi:hypothetical protein
MKTVPEIPLQEVPPHLLIPMKPGTFKAKITEFGEVKPARSGSTWFLGIRIQFEHEPDRPCFTYVAGYPATLSIILASKEFWLNREIDVRVSIREYDGRKYNAYDPIWRTEPKELKDD